MIQIFHPLRSLSFFSVLVRMLLSMISGLVIGLERSAKNRPAGFRTHILVCIGACAASMTGHYVYLVLQLPTDMTRIGAQVITGLGFIGAGTIIVTRSHAIKGLTTAAGLWTCGVIGLTFGAGFFEGGLIATVLVVLTESLFAHVGLRIKHPPNFKVILDYNHKESLDHVQRFCKDHNVAVTGLQITSNTEPSQTGYSALISLRAHSNIDPDILTANIRAIPGVESAALLMTE